MNILILVRKKNISSFLIVVYDTNKNKRGRIPEYLHHKWKKWKKLQKISLIPTTEKFWTISNKLYNKKIKIATASKNRNVLLTTNVAQINATINNEKNIYESLLI